MDGVLSGMFATPAGASVTADQFVLRLLVSFLLGQLVGWFYARSHGALSYSQSFVHALVLLAMVICTIMGVVGDSLARAFGLAAALAIVRFRTPVKDARDTVFLFLAVAVGMASGAGQLVVAIVASLGIGGAALWLGATAYASRSEAEGLLRLRFAGDDAGRDAMHVILRRHCGAFRLSAARSGNAGDAEELVFELDLRDPARGHLLVGELTQTGFVTGVTLLPQARAGES